MIFKLWFSVSTNWQFVTRYTCYIKRYMLLVYHSDILKKQPLQVEWFCKWLYCFTLIFFLPNAREEQLSFYNVAIWMFQGRCTTVNLYNVEIVPMQVPMSPNAFLFSLDIIRVVNHSRVIFLSSIYYYIDLMYFN